MISIILGGNMFSFLPFLNALGTFQKFISFSVAFEDSSLQLVIWLAFLQIPMQGLMKAGKQMILFPSLSIYLSHFRHSNIGELETNSDVLERKI